MYFLDMKLRNVNIAGFGLVLVAGFVVACSDDSGNNAPESEVVSNSGIPGIDQLPDSVLVVRDGDTVTVHSGELNEGDVLLYSSSSIVIGSSGAMATSSSSVNDSYEGDKDKGGHDGPLPGEDSNQVIIDEPLQRVEGFPVIFSEVSPSNASLKDNDGNDPAWVELYNTSDAPVDLKGVGLTNDAHMPRRWIFGNATIPAKAHMVVFLSGKNFSDYVQPSDSVNMVSSNCSAQTNSGGGNYGGVGDWGGGMPGGGTGGSTGPNVDNLPGQSSICFSENGGVSFGSVMKVSAGGMMMMGGGSGATSSFMVNTTGNTNLSKANQFVLKGVIDKGHKIRMSLNGTGGDWSKNLRGSGEERVYYVTIKENKSKLNNVTGSTFTLETEGSETTTIKVTSYIARNRGHEPHTTFKAENSGILYLTNSENAILDSVSYDDVPNGTTWSKNESGAWGIASPTPYGNTLGDVFASQAQSAETSIPQSGFYSSAVSVTFPAGTRCETGGAEATPNSALMTQTLSISATTVLRCRTYGEGMYPSDEIIRTYVFDQTPSLPAIFVTTDPLSMFSQDSGLYMTGNNAAMMDPKKGANFWSNRVLPVYVELFEKGAFQKPAFGIMGDYQISGQYSRAKQKKSFSVTMREEYGDKRLKYNLFPDHPELKKFKAFSLRNFGNNSGDDYVRDRLGTSMTEGLDVDYQRGRYVVVYYNGKYYGIHDLRERNNEYYYETKYGYDPDDIDLLATTSSGADEPSAGSAEDYKALLDWLQGNELTSDANYQKVAEQIDIDNFINYMQAEMFLNNSDWPHNNMKKWRVASLKSKWRWFLYDTDFGFGVSYNTQNGNVFSYVTNANGTGGMGGFNIGDFGGGMGGDMGQWGGNMGGGQAVNPAPAAGSISVHTILMIRLLGNEGFKNAFINRFCVLLNTNFSAERLLKRINDLQSQVEAEISRDAAFWGYDVSSMNNNLEKIKSYAQTRQSTIMSQMKDYFKLGDNVQMQLGTQGNGTIKVNGLPLDQSSLTISFFRDVPVTLTAEPKSGSVFSGWSDGNTETTRKVNPGEVTSVTAVFK